MLGMTGIEVCKHADSAWQGTFAEEGPRPQLVRHPCVHRKQAPWELLAQEA